MRAPAEADPAYGERRRLRLWCEDASERACKPGSVGSDHFSGAGIARPPRRDRPGGQTKRTASSLAGPPCLVLLPAGFAVPMLSPASRCALTAPFHPCLIPRERAIGGLFSVALSRSLRTVGVTHHRVLWSPDFPPLSRDRSDHSARSEAEVLSQGSPGLGRGERVEG